MSTLTIHDIDKHLETQLRIRAAEHGHSVEDEVREILRQAVRDQIQEKGLGTWIHQQFAAVGGVELEIPERDYPVRIVEFPEGH